MNTTVFLDLCEQKKIPKEVLRHWTHLNGVSPVPLARRLEGGDLKKSLMKLAIILLVIATVVLLYFKGFEPVFFNFMFWFTIIGCVTAFVCVSGKKFMQVRPLRVFLQQLSSFEYLCGVKFSSGGLSEMKFIQRIIERRLAEDGPLDVESRHHLKWLAEELGIINIQEQPQGSVQASKVGYHGMTDAQWDLPDPHGPRV